MSRVLVPAVSRLEIDLAVIENVAFRWWRFKSSTLVPLIVSLLLGALLQCQNNILLFIWLIQLLVFNRQQLPFPFDLVLLAFMISAISSLECG